jgi:predicted nucleotidyltransferase
VTLLEIIVFGSVARGTQTGNLDSDLVVVADDDRTSARPHVTDIVGSLGEQRFGGDRFDFEPHVESAASVQRAGAKRREISGDGTTMYGGGRRQSIRKAVVSGEQPYDRRQ